MILRSLVAASLLASAAAAQSPTDRRAAERDLFERMIEIPTVAHRNQMPRLVKLVAAEFRAAGITDITVKDHEGQPGDRTQSMIVRWPAAKPSGKKPILLLAHMDVVEAKRSDWTHDPFEFRETDGYYWGRGAIDNKNGVAAVTAALTRLKRSGFQPARDIVVLFTGDEETKQEGARLGASEWRALTDAEYALNADAGGGSFFKDGKPRGFAVQVAEKTYADYAFTTTNRGGHSSGPRPDNAIYQLAGALKALEEYRFEPRLNEVTTTYFRNLAAQDKGRFGEMLRSWLDDPQNEEKADLVETLMPGTTRTRCVATQLEAGHAPNALPQKAQANVNCRIFPGTEPEEVRKELQAIAGKQVTVKLVDGGTWSNPSPLRQDVLGAYAEALAAKYGKVPITPQMSSGATDALFFRAAGIPTYGVDASWSFVGEPLGAHGTNERIPIRAFHDNIDIWVTMLRRLAG